MELYQQYKKNGAIIVCWRNLSVMDGLRLFLALGRYVNEMLKPQVDLDGLLEFATFAL